MGKSASLSDITVRGIFTLAGPTMLEQLMNTAVQYVDTAMVGSLGTQATAAVGSTGTINWLVSSTISAVGIGFLACISQACGEKNFEKAKRAAAQSVLAALVLGTLFTVLTMSLSWKIPLWMRVEPDTVRLAGDYFFILYSPMLFRTATIIFGTVLRAAGDTKSPMKIGLLVNAVNVVLNFFLIYPSRELVLARHTVLIHGMGWGIRGAALASAAAFVLGGISITWILWRHPFISPRGKSFRPDKYILKPCLMVALPNSLQRFGTCFGYVVFASMINSLGDTATAAHTIANTVESAFYIPGYGMQTAAAALAGSAYGERNAEKLQKLGRTILGLEVILMCLSGVGLFLLAPHMVKLFSTDLQVIMLGSVILRMVALSEPFYGFSIIVEGMLQGMGRTAFSLAVNLLGMWMIRILGTWLCIRYFGTGLISAWACMIGHNLMLFAVYAVLYSIGKWNTLEKSQKSA